ncbi:MAG: hypothetical protein NVS9B15_14230 [Acidobacteriaceae bacterium]
MRDMGVVSGFRVVAFGVVLRRQFMMLGCVLVVLGSVVMMVCNGVCL